MISLNKKKAIFIFNSIDKPFLKIITYLNNLFKEERTIYFEPYEVCQDVIMNLEKVADTIKKFNLNIDEIYLCLNCSSIFKNTMTFPKIGYYKTNKLYKKELKNILEKTKGKYVNSLIKHEYSLGHIYYTYFIPNEIINSFKKLARLLNAKLKKYNLYSTQIVNFLNIDKNLANTVIYLEENNLAIFIYPIDGVVCSSISFLINEKTDINMKLFAYLSKHEYELEKEAIKNLYIYSNIKRFDSFSDYLNVEYKQINFNKNFIFKGNKI